MKDKNIILLIISIPISLCFLFIITISFILGAQNISKKQVRIVNINLCNGKTPESIISEEKTPVLSSSQNSIHICGFLKADRSVILSMYLYKEPDDEPIYTNVAGETFTPGYIFIPINLSNTYRVGKYRVDIYYERNIIATKSFIIK